MKVVEQPPVQPFGGQRAANRLDVQRHTRPSIRRCDNSAPMRAALVVVLLAGLAVAADGQQAPPSPSPAPGPSFRVEVNYVEVDASVTDAQGNPVTDLTAADFELLEDGRAQNVTNFSLVHLPIARAERPLFAAQPIEADVQTNEQIEGRIYLIVLDDLHIDPTRNLRVR